MQISKDSWHYRLNDYAQANFAFRARTELFTTCSYIRTTIFSLILRLIVCGWIGALSFIGLIFLASAVYFTVGLLGYYPIDKDLATPGAILMIMTAFFCIIATLTVIVDYLSPRLKAYKERKQSLLRQALQDKKDGICTIVEFE